MSIDYVAMLQKGIENPDRRPDGSGLDDGPPLPRSYVNMAKKILAREMWMRCMTLRDISKELKVSHETVRVWTNGLSSDLRRRKKQEGGE